MPFFPGNFSIYGNGFAPNGEITAYATPETQRSTYYLSWNSSDRRLRRLQVRGAHLQYTSKKFALSLLWFANRVYTLCDNHLNLYLHVFSDGRLHNGDNAEIKKYFVSFWNGVDLRYKLLKGPKVRISIAGIIISRVRRTMAFLILCSLLLSRASFLFPLCRYCKKKKKNFN